MNYNSAYDLIVIGGGVLGTFHAYHALQAGLRVALLEKDSQPIGATVRNFGQVVPSGLSSELQACGRQSLEIYRSLAPILGDGFRRSGSVYLASNDAESTLLHELRQINRHHEYPSELWNAATTLRKVPGVRPEYIREALFFPEEMSIDPRQAIYRILRFLKVVLGLDYYPRRMAIALETTSSGVNVRANTGEAWRAEKVVVCSGSEFQALYPDLFCESDIQLVKLQMLETKPQERLRFEPNILTGKTIRRYEAFRECTSYEAIKQAEPTLSFGREHGVHILFKQSADGSVILGDSHEYAPVRDAASISYGSSNAINIFLLEQAMRIMDLDTWEIKRIWNGYYCQTEEAPVFQRTIDEHIHICTGIGGKGMTMGPAYAKQHLQEIGVLPVASVQG